ncbi:MAG: DUF4214 domain-containing protein [Arenicella sp.]|nr:DUF4214 domain-containing protein [Arenicella sp.]
MAYGRNNMESLADDAFVDFCYQTILGRTADAEGKAVYIDGLKRRRLTREEILLKFLTSPEYESRKRSHEFVHAGHFYSAVPSIEDRDAFVADGTSIVDTLPGISINQTKQLSLMTEFKHYYNECRFPEQKTAESRFYFSNPAYGHTDALTLYGMMRHFKPNKVIEVGSGFSSCAMLDTNDQFFNSEIEFTFIEPYPELLNSLLSDKDNHRVIGENVQKVDLELFSQLQKNDILFIDSTHVSKLNSDVNRIIFEILPALQDGVLIHFHDIFWPFEYPKNWVKEGRAWNEAYLLRAFLEYNTDFEILFFGHYMHLFYGDWIANNMPQYLNNLGGNIWLRKIASK